MNIVNRVISARKRTEYWKEGVVKLPHRSLVEALSIKNDFNLSLIGEIRNHAPTYAGKTKWGQSYLLPLYSKYCQAINVFIEKNIFQGDIAWISEAKKTGLPVLVLDFFVDEMELSVVRSHGADAVILIADIVSKEKLAAMTCFGKRIGLEVVVEVQDEEGVRRAISAGADVIGINNRSLNNLRNIDLNKPVCLNKIIPNNIPIIVESGISSPLDQLRYSSFADAVMIGTAIVESDDPEKTLSDFSSLNKENSLPYIWTKPSFYYKMESFENHQSFKEVITEHGFKVAKRISVQDPSVIANSLYKEKLKKYPKEGLYWYWILAGYYDYYKSKFGRLYSELIFLHGKNSLEHDLLELNQIKKKFRRIEERQKVVHSFCGELISFEAHSFHVPNPSFKEYLEDMRSIINPEASGDIISYIKDRKFVLEDWFREEYKEYIPWLC